MAIKVCVVSSSIDTMKSEAVGASSAGVAITAAASPSPELFRACTSNLCSMSLVKPVTVYRVVLALLPLMAVQSSFHVWPLFSEKRYL